MYKLKQVPEDFVVKEVKNLDLKDSGKYSFVKVSKKGYNTLDIVKKLSYALRINKKQIRFAGNKDKNAVTEQIFSLENAGQKKIENLDLGENIKIEFLGYYNERISLGELEGNKFEIVIRELGDLSLDKIQFFPNYFDEQRFSEHNVEIGRALVKKEFGKSVELIGNFKCNEHLEQHANDYVGALKKLSMRLLRIYINAYQSFIWNKVLAEHLSLNGEISSDVEYSQGKFVFVKDAEKFLDLEIPLIGFNTDDWNGDSSIKSLINKIMRKERLDYENFIIKQIPELSAEGDVRKAFVEVKDLVIGEVETDELNEGKKKVKVSFELGKGSYATMAVRAIIGSSN